MFLLKRKKKPLRLYWREIYATAFSSKVLLLKTLLNDGKDWHLIGAAWEMEIHAKNRTLYSAKINKCNRYEKNDIIFYYRNASNQIPLQLIVKAYENSMFVKQ